jgi:hypothetical protein
MTLATTEHIQSYGGFQLSLENLESMRQALMTQAVQTRLFHDARRPLRVENVEAEIEQRADGEHVLWLGFDADEEVWRRSTKRSGMLKVLPEGSRSPWPKPSTNLRAGTDQLPSPWPLPVTRDTSQTSRSRLQPTHWQKSDP